MRAPAYRPNQVAPLSTTDARFRDASNGGGVVGALAAGLAGVAAAGAEFAITQDGIDEQNDDTQSRLLSAEAGKQYDIAVTEYSQLKAGQAREANPEFQARLEKIKQESIEQAPTDRARRFLEGRLSSIHDKSVSSITRHAFGEARVERKVAFETQRDAYAERAIGASDPAERDLLLNSGLAVVDDYLTQYEGLDEEANPEAFELARLDFTSKVHGQVVEGMLAEANPSVDNVLGYVRAYGDEMTQDLKASLLKNLQSPLQDRSARTSAAKVLDRVSGLISSGDHEGHEHSDGGVALAASDVVAGRIHPNGRFSSTRDGGRRQHAALDISAPVGTPIYAPKPGKVTKVRKLDGASGNWVEVTHPDGTSSTYSHMNDFSVAVGDTVGAGGQLGTVGNTGSGTGPHLHLVTRDKNGKRIDPETVLGQPTEGGSYGSEARDWDRAQVMSAIDDLAKEEGWNPEETERVRVEVMRQVNQEEGLLREAQGDAADQATRIIAELPNGLENINQIPQAVRDKMDPTDVARLTQGVRQRKRAEAEAAASRRENQARTQAKLTLQIMKRMEPDKFRDQNLMGYAGVLSPSEFTSFFLAQQDMINAPKPDYTPQSRIGGAITRGERYHGIKVSKGDLPAVYDFMEDRLKTQFEKNGVITLNDADDALKAAMQVAGKDEGWIWDSDIKGYEMSYDDIPKSQRDSIIRNWRGGGKPSQDDVLRIYRQMLN